MTTTCVITSVALTAYGLWLTHVCRWALKEGRRQAQKHADADAALAKARKEFAAAQAARRSLPLVILAVAVGYAHQAKN